MDVTDAFLISYVFSFRMMRREYGHDDRQLHPFDHSEFLLHCIINLPIIYSLTCCSSLYLLKIFDNVLHKKAFSVGWSNHLLGTLMIPQ